jgi:hypothetical protein
VIPLAWPILHIFSSNVLHSIKKQIEVLTIIDPDMLLKLLLLFSLLSIPLIYLNFTVMTMQEAFADSIKGSIRQNIGNYNMEMKTDPSNPIAGQNTKILLRIGSINGDDLVDLPILIRISLDGKDLTKTNPILVPYGHYVYNYIFPKTGIYALNVDINNDYYSGQNITFTFPINVNGQFLLFPYVNSSSSTGITVAGIIIIAIAVSVIALYIATHLRRQKNLQRTKV